MLIKPLKLTYRGKKACLERASTWPRMMLCKSTLMHAEKSFCSLAPEKIMISWHDYMLHEVPTIRLDFPPQPTSAEKQAMIRHEYLEVTTASDIQNEADYLTEIGNFNQQATLHEARTIQEHLSFQVQAVAKHTFQSFHCRGIGKTFSGHCPACLNYVVSGILLHELNGWYGRMAVTDGWSDCH